MLWAALGCVRIPFIALVNKDHGSRKLFEAKSQYDQFIYNRLYSLLCGTENFEEALLGRI